MVIIPFFYRSINYFSLSHRSLSWFVPPVSPPAQPSVCPPCAASERDGDDGGVLRAGSGA